MNDETAERPLPALETAHAPRAAIARLEKGGRLRLPEEMLRRYGLRPGQPVAVQERGDGLRVVALDVLLAEMWGGTAGYLAERDITTGDLIEAARAARRDCYRDVFLARDG